MDTLNQSLHNVLETMQRVVQDRESGLRVSDSIIALDEGTCPLSPKYPMLITVDGTDFCSCEHLLQYCKALSARDLSAARRIGSTLRIADALRVPIARFDIHTWRRHEERAMRMACIAKLKQHPSALALLKSTHTKQLVYASPSDVYFGCGLSINSDNVFFKQYWRGHNKLGVILDSLRNTI